MHSAPMYAERADVHVAAAPAPPRLRLIDNPNRPRRSPCARSVRVYALGALVGFLLAAVLSAPGGAEIVAIQLTGAVAAAIAAAIARVRELKHPRQGPTLLRQPRPQPAAPPRG